MVKDVSRVRRLPVIAGVAAVGALLTASCAPVLDASPFTLARIQAETPACDAVNTGPWVGRVSGQMLLMPGTKVVSLVGCFPTQEQCNAWRRFALIAVSGRIIYNECRTA
ncbi:hypothetical protein [Pseudoxanthobacter sp. M-2]|uniref:hypothetical protein n=1 Tax=Pseudoxanthobacter sp. M-2 TaxID=3078754 RepID=UPI0038FD23C7